MSATVIADLRFDTELFEHTEKRLRAWAAACQSKAAEENAVARSWRYRDVGTAEVMRMVRARRERRETLKQKARRRREARQKALMRRGTGKVVQCERCSHIYRGLECKRCKDDPKLTARGTETRSCVPPPEAQYVLRGDALLVDDVVDVLPGWMKNAIYRRFRWEQTDMEAADELMMSPAVFAGRVRAAVERVALLLAERKRM